MALVTSSATAKIDQSDNPYVGVATKPGHERKDANGVATGDVAIQVLRQRKSGNLSPARTAWLFDSAEELRDVATAMLADATALMSPSAKNGKPQTGFAGK